jgi:hypothetical protein
VGEGGERAWGRGAERGSQIKKQKALTNMAARPEMAAVLGFFREERAKKIEGGSLNLAARLPESSKKGRKLTDAEVRCSILRRPSLRPQAAA